MSGNVEIELTGAGKDRKLVVRNNSDAVVTISADLAGLLVLLTAPASDAPTAYCATCGHDHPVDERDYPGEPERYPNGLTEAGINQIIKEWRQRADHLDSTGNSWASSAAGVYRYCANAIDPTYQHKFPTEEAPKLPDDEPSYTVDEVVSIIKLLHSVFDVRVTITEDRLKSFIKQFESE